MLFQNRYRLTSTVLQTIALCLLIIFPLNAPGEVNAIDSTASLCLQTVYPVGRSDIVTCDGNAASAQKPSETETIPLAKSDPAQFRSLIHSQCQLWASIALWATSLFLLSQGAAFQRWVMKDDSGAPAASRGILGCWALSAIIICFWCLMLVGFSMPRSAWPSFPFALLAPFIAQPANLAFAFLLASLAPGALAIYKFMMTSQLMRSVPADAQQLSRSPMAAFFGGSFALIQLMSSVATLYMFCRS